MPEETSSMESETVLAVCTGMESIIGHAHALLTTEILSPTSRGRVEAMRIIARYTIEIATATRSMPPDLDAPAVRETILLVKDSVAVSALIARVLRSHGYRVVEALTAERAVDRLSEETSAVDVALVDLTTPGSSLDQLADRLRARQPSLRVLFMSGQDAREVAARLVVDERTGFIPKPFVVEDLLTGIRDLISR